MKKKSVLKFLIFTILILIIGCKSTPEVNNIVDAKSSASIKGTGWEIKLSGARDSQLFKSNLNEWEKLYSNDFEIKEFESKGVLNSYKVIKFSKIIGMIDDANPDKFNKDLWDMGYQVILESEDGYSIGFNTGEVNIFDMYLAFEKNNNEITPSIVGNISSSIKIKDLTNIIVNIDKIDLKENNFIFELKIGDSIKKLKIKDIQNSKYYFEGPGQFINSYGNIFQYNWGGIKLVDYLSQYTTLTKDNIITIKSMDGYEMDYSGEQILDQSDGYWLLAIKQDGQLMSEDPGYIRLVKAGENNPIIDGHCSAKMVQQLIVKNGVFNDFTISIVNGSTIETMDRQSLQSGVTVNKNIVNYYDKKRETTTKYIGLPLYDFFLRYNDYKNITIEAKDGYSITLNRSDIENNKDVIVAMYYEDFSELEPTEFPLVLVWDKEASLIPEGIKKIKCISKFILN